MLTVALFLGVFLALVVCLKLGAWTGSRTPPEATAFEGTSTVDAAVLALAGFLLAFSFSGAQERLQDRREILVREANAIGTAYLRTDLADEPERSQMRDLLRDYVDLRMRGTEALPDLARSKSYWTRAETVGRQVWGLAVQGTEARAPADRTLVVGAVNDVLDVATERSVAVMTHTPTAILAVLAFLTATASFLAGRSLIRAGRSRGLHQIVLALVFALAITVLVDLDHPRMGLIRLTAGDTAMESLRASMTEETPPGPERPEGTDAN